jgi:hypothetical protein
MWFAAVDALKLETRDACENDALSGTDGEKWGSRPGMCDLEHCLLSIADS